LDIEITGASFSVKHSRYKKIFVVENFIVNSLDGAGATILITNPKFAGNPVCGRCSV
jgi:hypothetical protein